MLNGSHSLREKLNYFEAIVSGSVKRFRTHCTYNTIVEYCDGSDGKMKLKQWWSSRVEQPGESDSVPLFEEEYLA